MSDSTADRELPAGYSSLIKRYDVKALPHHRQSFIGRERSTRVFPNTPSRHTYPPSYAPGEDLTRQLEFALKYDGVNLEILGQLFERGGAAELTEYVRRRPRGKYARRLWFLYEFLTGKRLDLEDAKQGNYIDLLEPDAYYTALPIKSRRHRVRDNLLGNADFCPLVRRTSTLESFESKRLNDVAAKMVEGYDDDVIHRAVSYLYTKETRSSYLIEQEEPGRNRTERFVALLRQAPHLETLAEDTLIELQNVTVDERFKARGYRADQNYVGAGALFGEKVHYVSPKPGDVRRLMDGLLSCLDRLLLAPIDPVVAAAVAAFGFVLIHPFDDGNGRLHRFLIHFVLARKGFTPAGLIFPVSAVMLRNMAAYENSLESFSRPLLSLVDYRLDQEGVMAVEGDTADHYRYFDATLMAEALYGWVEETIQTEFKDQLDFLVHFRAVKQAMQEIVDLPDRLLSLFIKLCLDNKGRLSKRKRQAHFAMLSDEETAALEAAIRERFDPETESIGDDGS